MTLVVKNIKLRNFRSYKNVSLDIDPSITIIFGPNAGGKTNIIEALQLTTEGISFRNPRWEEVIYHSTLSENKNITEPDLNQACVDGFFSAGSQVSMHAEGDGFVRDVLMRVSDSRRSYEVNGKKVRSSKDVSGALPCVIFTPEDLALVKASSENRRGEIDNLGSQLSKKYNLLLSEYKKVIQHRNRLLKEEHVYDDVFGALTDQATTLGASFFEHRLKLIARLIPLFKEAYSLIGGVENLKIGYKTTLDDSSIWFLDDIEQFLSNEERDTKGRLLALLERKKQEEVSRKSTIVGPHRDDLVFFIDGKDVRSFGSQGQQRSVVLAWKIAEIQVVEQIIGRKPLLLLDDVMSELDEARRTALTNLIESMGQTIITTAHIGYFEKNIVKKAKLVDVTTLEGEGNVALL